MTFRCTCLVSLILVAFSAQALVSDIDPCPLNDSCAPGTLEEIVVTGTRSNRSILENPATLSVISGADIERINTDTIAELMRDIPGVTIDDSGQAGLKRIRIRGEESRRIALLIDGQEFTDHREVGVPMLIDPASVERIEVVKGPASVLYGAKALGGVVNIITKRGGPEPVGFNLSAGYDSATDGLRSVISVGGASNSYYYRLAATNNDQNDRESPEGSVENTSYSSDSISASLGKSILSDGFAGKQSIELVYEDFNSDSEVYVEPEVRFAPPFLDFAIDAPQRDREKLAAFYQFSPNHEYLAEGKLNFFHQVSDRQFDTFTSMFIGVIQDSAIYTTSELVSDGGVAQLDWQLGTAHYVISGVQYNRDKEDQTRAKETVTNAMPPVVEHIDDQASMTTWAVFVQDEWGFAENWKLTSGLRQYRVDASLDATTRSQLATGNQSDDHLIGSLALVYSGFDFTTIRTSFSQGYIYPSLLQLAMGAYAGSRFVNPDLNLKPETSDTFEFGIRYQNNQWVLDTTAFYSSSENYIDHLFCTTDDQCLGSRDKIYKNVSNSEAYGVELHLAYQPESLALSPYVNLGFYHRKNEYDTFTTDKSGIPEIQGNLGVQWQQSYASSHLQTSLFVRFESRSELEEPGSSVVVRKANPGWGSLNADLGLDLGDHYRVTMNLSNLLDKTYSTSTENLLAPGRSVRITLSLAM